MVPFPLPDPARSEDRKQARSASSGKRLRVLAIAEMANPDWVSVPLVGWSHARALARVADVHLVTHLRNRENILKAGLREGEDFVALDTGAADKVVRGLAWLLRAGRGVGWSSLTAASVIPYYRFEQLLWRQFGARLRNGEFDVVHRITPLSPSVPSLLARRCAQAGVPFVLGPINGGVPWPAGFDGVRRREREWLTALRPAYKLLPGANSAHRHAAAILVGSTDMYEQIEPRYRDKLVYLPENGLDPAWFEEPAQRSWESPPLRVAFAGRLVAVKCVDVLIEAAAPLLRAGKMTLEIAGDGPELSALRAQTAREGVGHAVNFAGWVDHHAMKARLATAHLFAFPSVRDFGGAVVLEAMAMGLVPMVVAHGGPRDLVNREVGISIPIGPRACLVSGFRAELERLAADPSSLAPVAARARERALRLFTWDAKARQVLEIYRWVRRERERPCFGMPFP